jgi:hypothetical protein
MQIQWWEGAALCRAKTVLQGTTHDTVRAEIGYGEKVRSVGAISRYIAGTTPESARHWVVGRQPLHKRAPSSGIRLDANAIIDG